MNDIVVLVNRNPHFTRDCTLFRHMIPVELRHVVASYTIESISDDNIHNAAKLWMEDKKAALLRYGHVSHWNTSQVTDMMHLFSFANGPNQKLSSFNDNIEDWDVRNVTNMMGMFLGCHVYNQPLNKWNMSKVMFNSHMFNHCYKFNQPLNQWDTSNISFMESLFGRCETFNQPLNTWDTSFVLSMKGMFAGANAFNQPLNDWDVSNVANMERMFCQGFEFNQPLNRWEVGNVTSMANMFCQATAFNQPVEDWDIRQVTNMEDMFQHALSFNQSLNRWHINMNTMNVTKMFHRASAFDPRNISEWIHPSTFSETSAFDDLASHRTWQAWVFERIKYFDIFITKYRTKTLFELHGWFRITVFAAFIIPFYVRGIYRQVSILYSIYLEDRKLKLFLPSLSFMVQLLWTLTIVYWVYASLRKPRH